MRGRIDGESILRRAGCEQKVIAHCRAVCRLAEKYSKHPFIDIELVKAGAMLHDVGRAWSHGIDHAQVGADYLRKIGIPEEVALIVERHIGAGMTADECREEGLSPVDRIPETVEEKIVAHADNLIRGDREITLEERLRRSSGLPEKVLLRIKKLAEEIEPLRK